MAAKVSEQHTVCIFKTSPEDVGSILLRKVAIYLPASPHSFAVQKNNIDIHSLNVQLFLHSKLSGSTRSDLLGSDSILF
jgi:hypothetical protein